jgi:hypothetical protein
VEHPRYPADGTLIAEAERAFSELPERSPHEQLIGDDQAQPERDYAAKYNQYTPPARSPHDKPPGPVVARMEHTWPMRAAALEWATRPSR